MVLQMIREGALKWMGPFLGCVFMRFLRNRSYFIFWRTSPPEMHTSSHLTITCDNANMCQNAVWIALW